MSRPPRIGFAGALHHVMARGDRREEIFRDDRDRLKFLGYLSEGFERYRVKAHCFVLMENHFHLVVTTTEANLSKWMHQLKTAYAVYFNRRYQLVGHLFQGRFRSTVVCVSSWKRRSVRAPSFFLQLAAQFAHALRGWESPASRRVPPGRCSHP